MASFQVTGFVSKIVYKQDFCMVFVDEFKRGFRRKDGTLVEDKYLSWRCVFKQGMAKYISDHFSHGMLVEVKGEVLPYIIEHDKVQEGYSVIGQCINLASFPRASAKQEIKMIKESQENDDARPNIDAYQSPDF